MHIPVVIKLQNKIQRDDRNYFSNRGWLGVSLMCGGCADLIEMSCLTVCPLDGNTADLMKNTIKKIFFS